jgi:uncharacterized membrane protein YeaQ/YmgE (transglycosylase-associated protein family)
MAKYRGQFTMAGLIIGCALGAILGQALNTVLVAQVPESIVIQFLTSFIGSVWGLIYSDNYAKSVKQIPDLQTILVRELLHVPQIQELNSALENGEIEVSHRSVLERYQYETSQDGDQEVQYCQSARVIKSDRQNIVLEITSWKFKYAWHRFISELKPNEYVFRVPHNINL